MREMHSKRPKFSKFSGGPCPRTPLEARALRRSLKTTSVSFSISLPTSQILPSTPFLIENPAFYQLLFIGLFPKKLDPKTTLQGPLWPSSKIWGLKHCLQDTILGLIAWPKSWEGVTYVTNMEICVHCWYMLCIHPIEKNIVGWKVQAINKITSRNYASLHQ